MKAWRVHELGSIDNLVLEDVEQPEPGPEDVVIRIRAIGLNSSEGQTIRGEYDEGGVSTSWKWQTPLPLIPGIEGAGEVVAVGDQVKTHQVGDRVTTSYWFCCGHCDMCRSGKEQMCQNSHHFQTLQFGRFTDGAYAEYAKLPADFAIHIPDGLSFEDAAAVTVGGGTSINVLFTHADIRFDETILITGAASNIGVIGVQLAKAVGMKNIVGTAGSDEKCERLLEIGCDHAINHRANPDFAEMAVEMNGGEGFDVVYDVPGGATLNPAVYAVKPRGRIVLSGYMGGRQGTLDIPRVITFESRILGSASWTRPALKHLLDLTSRELIEPIIDATLPFEELPTALKRLEDRVVFGKVIVKGVE